MQLQIAFVVFVLLCSRVGAAGFAHSLSIQRSPHQFAAHDPDGPHGYSAPNSILVEPSRRTFRNGNSIPMSGGFLTLGAYFVNVQVGNPTREFSVLVDTGSSNLGIPGVGCSPQCSGDVVYDYLHSTTSRPIACHSEECDTCVPYTNKHNETSCIFGAPFCARKSPKLCGYGITYGGGSSALGGMLVEDQVCLGDLCARATINVILDQYSFESNFNSSSFYGILGLASPENACNPTCIVPLYDVYAQERKTNNLFSMCLTAENGGVLDMGFIDKNKYSGVMQWVPILTYKWYNIGLKDILVGTQSLQLPEFAYVTTNDVIGAFVDSGTSIILVSPLAFGALTAVFQSYYCNLPGVCGNVSLFEGSFCVATSVIGDKLASFPPVSFVFNGVNGDVTIAVKPQDYLMLAGNQYCLGIQGAIGVGAVLGDVFMQSQYIVFDRETMRLGFAPLTKCV